MKMILTADWHLRENQPICRSDDFWKIQWEKVRFIRELQYEYDCTILHSGDLFHHWKPSPRLLSKCIEELPYMFVIPGNHDLPNHNLNLLEKSGLFTLEKAEIIKICSVELEKPFLFQKDIAIMHKLINHSQSDNSAKSILRKYKKFKLILTGDNHETFDASINNRLLINPGSLTRQTANQKNHKPCIYIIDIETMGFEIIEIPIENNVFNLEHLNQQNERDERIENFVKHLNSDYDLELSFESNLKAYFQKNRTRKAIKSFVWKFFDQ